MAYPKLSPPAALVRPGMLVTSILAAHLDENEMSPVDAAEQLSCSVSFLSRIRSHQTAVGTHMIPAIAEMTGIEENALWVLAGYLPEGTATEDIAALLTN